MFIVVAGFVLKHCNMKSRGMMAGTEYSEKIRIMSNFYKGSIF